MTGAGIIQPVAELTLTAKLNAFRANGAIEERLRPGSQCEAQSQLYRFSHFVLTEGSRPSPHPLFF